MDLSNVSERGNVEDRRGSKGPLAVGGGLGAIVVTLIAGYLGINPQMANQLFQAFAGAVPQKQQAGPGKADGYKEFSEKLLGTTNRVWAEQFQRNGYGRYQEPGMVLFSEKVDSEGCGIAPSKVGPFYCPASRKVFLDPTFFVELEQTLGGSAAEFSQAYVIGHEVGHHVQNLRGYNKMADDARDGRGGYQKEGENGGIRLELQADYLAGVWAHHARNTLKINESDIREAMKTARSIGDNRIQEKMRGKSWPESFNHGTDAQRMKHFMRGYETGDASKESLDKFFNPRTRPLDL
jgi:uncharacterized protein